ncbi:uncharacterized protein [Leptinotarsa decemlineata]|uniref:uncharacterized protein n=1 Tax=Leptinotarsa decemlineata TaxID=7539 RepID=UPI003D30C908
MFLKDKNTPKHTRDSQEHDLENTQYEDSSETILTEGFSSTFQLQHAGTSHDTVKQLETITKKRSGKELNSSDPHDIGIESEPFQRDTVRQLVSAGKETSGKRPNMSDPQMNGAFESIKTPQKIEK